MYTNIPIHEDQNIMEIIINKDHNISQETKIEIKISTKYNPRTELY
jgi:hypothetical protein